MTSETMQQAAERYESEVKRILGTIKITMHRGKQLDAIAQNYGLERLPRRHWWWPFRESDRKLHGRVLDALRSPGR